MIRVLLAGATAVALLGACAHSTRSTAAAPAPVHAGAQMAMCPMAVPGTTVVSADEVNGATVTFTSTDQVAELQRRVHAMVAMHNQRHGDGKAHEGMMGHGMMRDGQGMRGMMLPSSQATVTALETGARVTLMPTDPADLQKLQAAVRMHAQKMQQDGCGMKGAMHHG